MSFMIEWITQIIIFLLLAAIVDLMIPANKMKKYVKFVLGLIFMLIFLQPLFDLFRIELEIEIDAKILLLEHEMTEASLENLTKIQKIDIQATQDAYILEQMANQLEGIANPTLIEEHQVEITKIDFLFHSEDVTYENLAEIIVYLQAVRQRGAVIEIDEVIILGEGNKDEKTPDDMPIKQFLEEVWEITDKKLTIKWEGGSS